MISFFYRFLYVDVFPFIFIITIEDNMYHTESLKGTFLEQTKAAREERALEKKRDSAAIKIQAHVRGWIAHKKFCKLIL